MQLHAIRKMINGQTGLVECLVIPIEKNKLFVGNKGVYLDLIAFEIDLAKRNKDSTDTHLVKQSFSKEVRDAMTEDQLKALPILGNLQVWDGQVESEPVSDVSTVQDEKDDLPF
ncbi:MAG: hypothetical protein ABFD04_00385 [Syntrophomonas sp.]